MKVKAGAMFVVPAFCDQIETGYWQAQSHAGIFLFLSKITFICTLYR